MFFFLFFNASAMNYVSPGGGFFRSRAASHCTRLCVRVCLCVASSEQRYPCQISLESLRGRVGVNRAESP